MNELAGLINLICDRLIDAGVKDVSVGPVTGIVIVFGADMDVAMLRWRLMCAIHDPVIVQRRTQVEPSGPHSKFKFQEDLLKIFFENY